MNSALIDKKLILNGSTWIRQNFSDAIEKGLNGTIFDTNLICAIACQESLYFWYNIRNKYDPEYILGRCVLDASGDDPSSPRNPFPRNTEEFRVSYGSIVTNMLIDEANKTRNLRGLSDAQWVYKGYGLFQYDLQFIKTVNPEFFLQKQWYSIDSCIGVLVAELAEIAKQTQDFREIVQRYNGSGAKAVEYANRVMTYYSYL